MTEPGIPEDSSSTGSSAAEACESRHAPAPDGASITLPILTESLHIEKVEVDRGGYRMTKRVDSRDVLVDEPLRHETVEIERRLLNRLLAEGEVPVVRHEGDTTIVPVVKEVVVTQKRLVLVEEIRIVRVSGTHRAPQSIAVREEHVEIERLGADTSVIRSS